MQDTIVAIATPPGVGAIGVIRLSGAQAITIVQKLIPTVNFSSLQSHTVRFGRVMDGNNILDEVVVTLYKNPRSYTGEDVVEISCHGSQYILQRTLQLCLEHGATLAKPGEFTQRAFFNGKMDLTQAEAVADLIAASSKAAQHNAMNQLRGGFSNDLQLLRKELIRFTALIELELDFSEEDVAFADRDALQQLLQTIQTKVAQLQHSFALGNALKNGVHVAIIGQPNAGKSTLLNALLNEDRAIVSDIAGTTRDTIEETLNINGVLFRLIDTAGIRHHTTDSIEQIGVGKSIAQMRKADVVLFLTPPPQNNEAINMLNTTLAEQTKMVMVLNKMDTLSADEKTRLVQTYPDALFISAKNKQGIDALKLKLYETVIGQKLHTESTIVTNARHHEALQKLASGLSDVQTGMNNQISGELLALDIRHCLHYLGEISGEVQVDRDVLGAIFGEFCIGK